MPGGIGKREDFRAIPRSPAVGLQRRDIPGIDRSRDEHSPSPRRGPGHVDRLHQGGRPVVQRRVRDLEGRQLAHHRLVLEQRLQHSLRQLGLVGRVGRVQLGPPREGPHQGGDIVVVGAAAREANELVRVPVPASQAAKLADQLHLRQPRRDGQFTPQPNVLWQMGEQVVDRREAARREHLAHVVVRMWSETHDGSLPSALGTNGGPRPFEGQGRYPASRWSSRPYLVTSER